MSIRVKAPVERPETPVVQDVYEDCVYRPGQTARCPARLPLKRLTPGQLDLLLEEGDQRVGATVFRTTCPTCRACEPVRVDIERFEPTRSQRRVLRRNDGVVEVTVGLPSLSNERVELWNRHRAARGLLTEHSQQDPETYFHWLVVSCAVTLEVDYRINGRLAAVSLLDLGERAVNSAYCFFDPDLGDRSLGVYSVLFEIAYARTLGMKWYYLGLWVPDCKALRYKTNYLPHERLVRNRWVRFEAPDERGAPVIEPDEFDG